MSSRRLVLLIGYWLLIDSLMVTRPRRGRQETKHASSFGEIHHKKIFSSQKKYARIDGRADIQLHTKANAKQPNWVEDIFCLRLKFFLSLHSDSGVLCTVASFGILGGKMSSEKKIDPVSDIGTSSSVKVNWKYYQPIALVTRGDEKPKKNYQTKKHPTYEVIVNIFVMFFCHLFKCLMYFM
jgi:hypothetical protein